MNIRHWFESKRGKNTLIAVLSLALVISILGQVVGWANIGRLITGTAGPGLGGYSCLPTCVENDGKFLSMPGEDMASFGGAKIVVWIEAPIGQSSFEVGIFDGDSGKDNEGTINVANGNWDNTETESTYTLYADPERDGATDKIVGQWKGNTDPMPNNAWYDITVNNVVEARNPNGRYYYRLEATRPIEGVGINAFKLRSTGQLSSGRSEVVDANFAIVGMLATLNDVKILWPEFQEDWENMGPSTYTGEWEFYFDVPAGTKTISFWDGDFDRGTATDIADDTDDPNTTGKPPWALSSAVDERAGGQGAPADDYQNAVYRRVPAAQYEVIGPEGQPIFTNEEPSGTEEWEKFVVTSDPDVPDEEADLRVEKVPAGIYTLRITGLDLHNTVWFRMNYEIGDSDCPECPVCEKCEKCEECDCATPTPEPPTPTPEVPTPTPEVPTPCPDPDPIDLLYVLDISGSMDMLYPGSGTKLQAAQEAIKTLNDWVAQQNNGSRVALISFYSTYPSGRPAKPLYPPVVEVVSGFTSDISGFNTKLMGLNAFGATPTAAALNQVTTWLPGAWDASHLPVVILISDGVPTVDLEQYGWQDSHVQRVSLYDNSGNFRTPADVRSSGVYYSNYGQSSGETLADTMLAIQGLKNALPNVSVYGVAIQAVHDGIFKDEILRYVAAQGGGEFYEAQDADALAQALQRAFVDSACGGEEPPSGGTMPPCANPRRNQYNVENPTTNPFNGIKFEFQSGTEIKNGLWDEYKITLTTAQAAALKGGQGGVKMAAKAGRATGAAVLPSDCQFNSSQPCGPVSNNLFTFSFQGAVDNGDGTMTLTFRVQNDRDRGLSYAAIRLPSGAVPSRPTNTYESVVCP